MWCWAGARRWCVEFVLVVGLQQTEGEVSDRRSLADGQNRLLQPELGDCACNDHARHEILRFFQFTVPKSGCGPCVEQCSSRGSVERVLGRS